MARSITSGGNHGYDNALESMGSLFVAVGPAFARGAEVPRVRAVDLYALMTEILGLRPAANDGSLDSIRAVLRTQVTIMQQVRMSRSGLGRATV